MTAQMDIQTKLPSGQEERWRRSNPETFDPQRFSNRQADTYNIESLTAEASKKIMEQWPDLVTTSHVLVVSGNHVTSLGIPLPKGVEVQPYTQAKILWPELVRASCKPRFDQSADATCYRPWFGAEHFDQWHRQSAKEVIFTKVAKETVVEHPLVFIHRPTVGGPALTTSYVVVGERAQVLIVDDHEALASGGQVVTFVEAERNANVTVLQSLGGEAHGDYLVHLELILAEHAQGVTYQLCSGGRKVKAYAPTYLSAASAQTKAYGAVLAQGRQHMDVEPALIHQAPYTHSDMLYKMILTGKGRAVFQGDITLLRAAQHSEAYQLNKNLLLSPSARVDTLPKLDILPDDVKCKHGAATGAIDPQQIWYLESRGFSRREAVKLILRGFVADVIKTLPEGPVHDHYERTLVGLADRVTEELES